MATCFLASRPWPDQSACRSRVWRLCERGRFSCQDGLPLRRRDECAGGLQAATAAVAGGRDGGRAQLRLKVADLERQGSSGLRPAMLRSSRGEILQETGGRLLEAPA